MLPGAAYSPDAPLLWFTGQVLRREGWTVLQVWDRWDRSTDARRWADDRFQAALDFVSSSSQILVVAKSLGTLVLPDAAHRRLPGIWLTPLLDDPRVGSALRVVSVPTLVVGGTGDSTWAAPTEVDREVVEVLEIPGADHALQYADDPVASLEVLRTVVGTVGSFLERLSH